MQRSASEAQKAVRPCDVEAIPDRNSEKSSALFEDAILERYGASARLYGRQPTRP